MLKRAASAAAACLIAALGSATTTGQAAQDFGTAPGPLTLTLTQAQRHDLLAHIDAVGRRGFLYEVSRPPKAAAPAARKLYLYGTIHLGRVGSEPFNGPVLTALRQSGQLVLEADPTDSASTQALAMQLGRYADDDGLQHHVSPALMARVRAFGEKNGMPPDHVARFKPWLLANMVALTEMSGAGLEPALGSELYLAGFARSRRMPILEVEGVEAQLHMLASLPDAMQTAQLDEALTEVGSAESQAQSKALFDLWFDGDGPAGDTLIAEMHRDAGDRLFERYFVETLIDQRNRLMADKAEGYLEKPGNTFFAVGSLHLFGEAGLLSEFRRRGYRVVDLQPPLAARR